MSSTVRGPGWSCDVRSCSHSRASHVQLGGRCRYDHRIGLCRASCKIRPGPDLGDRGPDDPYEAAATRLEGLIACVGSAEEELIRELDAELGLGERVAMTALPLAVRAAVAGGLSCACALVYPSHFPLHFMPNPASPWTIGAMLAAAAAVPCAELAGLGRPQGHTWGEALRARRAVRSRRFGGLPPWFRAATLFADRTTSLLLSLASAELLRALVDAAGLGPSTATWASSAMAISALRANAALVDHQPDAKQCAAVYDAAHAADRYYAVFGAPRGLGADAVHKPKAGPDEACRAFRAVAVEWFAQQRAMCRAAGWTAACETLCVLGLWHWSDGAVAPTLLLACLLAGVDAAAGGD